MIDFFQYFEEWNMVSVAVRLTLATLFGGIIGIERASKRHAAGLRTFALVSLGAALATVTNQYLVLQSGSVGDLARMPAQVISGIGFLGVGTIIVTRKSHVKGLTTAASLWAAATMGIALGAGFVWGGTIAFILIMITVSLLQSISKYQEDNNRIIELYLEVEKSKGVEQLLRFVHGKNYEIRSIEKSKQKTLQESDVVILLELNMKIRQKHAEVIEEFSRISGVHYLEEVK